MLSSLDDLRHVQRVKKGVRHILSTGKIANKDLEGCKLVIVKRTMVTRMMRCQQERK